MKKHTWKYFKYFLSTEIKKYQQTFLLYSQYLYRISLNYVYKTLGV